METPAYVTILGIPYFVHVFTVSCTVLLIVNTFFSYAKDNEYS